jgi:adenylate cyclase class 2
MSIEVEQKFRVERFEPVEQILRGMQIDWSDRELQVDTYFAHPARDFAQTDEALRMRRIGEDNFVTYKGPKLDATTKTRREIELPLPPGDDGASQFAELLVALGFRRVAEVRKHRRHAHLPVEGADVVAALDEVTHVGCFVELEAVVEERLVDAAKVHLAAWAAKLGLRQNERRSYLELLLASQGRTG